MYKISYSKEKNRIYINISGKLTDIEEKNYINEMLNCLDLIEPNFTVCSDMKDCDPSVIIRKDQFDIIRHYGEKKSVYKVACVLDLGSLDPNLVQKYFNLNIVFKDISEAENYLDS